MNTQTGANRLASVSAKLTGNGAHARPAPPRRGKTPPAPDGRTLAHLMGCQPCRHEYEAEVALAGFSDQQLHGVLRRRRLTRPTRDRRANPGSATGKAVENDEYLAMLARMLARAPQRVGAGKDIDSLARLARMGGDLDDLTAATVQALIDGGYSWSDVGDVLGVTKQSAWRRYSKVSAQQRAEFRAHVRYLHPKPNARESLTTLPQAHAVGR